MKRKLFFLAFILITLTLFMGTDVSLYDNGDYSRVMRLSSLYMDNGVIKISEDTTEWFSAIPKILFDTTGVYIYPSSQLIFIRLSVVISLFINKIAGFGMDTYHISVLGVMYSIMYAAAIAFALGSIRLKNKRYYVAVALALIILCDLGYVSYFNSLYGEGLQHILLIAFIGFMISDVRKRNIILCSVVIVLYGTSKAFNIPCAFLFGAMYFIKAIGKHKVTSVVSAILSAVVLISSFVAIPDWIGNETNYNSVFFGILRGTDEAVAKEYLADLGLPEDMSELRDTNHYVSNFSEIETAYDLTSVDELKYLELVAFYAKRPLLTLKKVPHFMKFCGAVRNIFFMDTAYMRGFRMTLWSTIRENTGFDTVWINTAIFTVFMLMLIMQKKRSALIFSALAVLYSLFMPYAANGDADLAKHMFMFAEFIDVMLIFIIFFGAYSAKRAVITWCTTTAVGICGFAFTNIKKEPETYNFGEREWYITDTDSEYLTLMSKDSVGVMVYDGESNTFASSNIRHWLNNDFLNEFTADERERLVAMEHKVIVNASERESAEVGERDFYCTAYPTLAGEGFDDAYGVYLTDLVTLPSIKQISDMAKEGMKVDLNENYWLQTCYFSDTEKVRYMNSDGLIYFASADEYKNIHPVVRVRR